MATGDYYKGVVIQYKGDDSNLSAVLSKMNTEMRQSQGAARALDAALKLDPKSLALVKDRAVQTERQIRTTTERIEALKSALGETRDPEVIERLTRQTDIAEARLRSLNEQLVRLRTSETMNSDSGIGKVATGAQELGGALQRAGESVGNLGNKLTMGLTVPITAFTVATVGAATTVDSALTDVRKTVDATEGEYQALKEAAIEYSKTNAVTADQVLQVQALGAQLGYAADELEMVGRVGSGLDLSTDMNAEQATTDMAQFANITGMAHDQTENYASTIIDLGNHMATTESKISAMAQRLGAAGKQVGMSHADILGLSAALSSVGLEAEAAGTAFSTIMSQIDKDVAVGGAGLQTWAKAAGMSAEQFASAWRSSPVDALSSVVSGMAAAAEAGGNMSIMLENLGVSSIRQTDGLKRLANNASILTDAVARANVAWVENTALTEEVANRNTSLESKMQMLQNRVTAVMEKVGKPVADALLSLVDAATPLFEAIESGAKAFSEMDASEQRVLVSTVATVAAFGPLLSVAGQLTSSLGSMVTGMGNAAQGTIGFVQAMRAGFTATEALEFASAGLGATLSSGLLGAGIVAAIALVGKLVADLKQWADHVNMVHDATLGLSKAVVAGNAALEGYGDAAVKSASSAKDAVSDADKALRSVADFAKTIKETLSGVGDSFESVDQYSATIKRLGNQGSITSGNLAELRNAVKQYNEITGATVEVTDETTGALNLLGSQIDEVTEAYRRQAEQEAYLELYNDAIREQAKVERELKDVTSELDVMTAKYGVSLGDAGTLMLWNVKGARDLESRQKELSDSAKALGEDIDYWKSKMDSTPATFETLGAAMTAAGVTGAQYESLTEQQLAALRSAFDGTLASIATLLGEYGISVKGAGDVAVSAAKDTAGRAAASVDSFATKLLDKQKSTNDEAYRLQQRAWQREEQAQSKANSKAVAAFREAHQEMLSELKAHNDAVYRQRSDELTREAKQQEKANEKALAQLKSQQEQATKVYRAETKKRLAEMDSEYKAKLKLVESEYSTETIDSQIKALKDETKAEQSEAKKREQQEKLSELRKAVERAKSRRKRAEAEKELSDYLADIAREQREEERDAQIDQLEQQKELMGEEAAAKKASLKEQYDQKKEQYEAERAEELERRQTQYQEDYEAERERLSTLLELRREQNSAELEAMKAQHKSIEDERSKQYDADEQSLRESLDQQLQDMRDAHQDALAEMKSTGSDIATATGDAAREVEQIVDEAATTTAKTVELGAEQAKGNLLKRIQEANTLVKKPAEGVANVMLDQLNPLRTEVPKVAEDATSGMNAELGKARPTTSSLAQQLNDAAWGPISGLSDKYSKTGAVATDGLASSLDRGRWSVESAARSVGDAQTVADRSGESLVWGADLVANLVSGMWSNVSLVSDVARSIGDVIDSFLHHSVPDKGPLREGGRGEAVWGADLVDNLIEGMRSREAMLAEQSERLAQIVEASFSPSLSARYDASLSAAQGSQRLAEVAGRAAATVVRVDMNLSMSGLSMSNTTDIRAASELLAGETVRKINAKLGG